MGVLGTAAVGDVGPEGAWDAPGAVSALASLFCCWVTSAPLHAGAAAARELTFGGLSCSGGRIPEMAGQGGREREEGVGKEVQICTDGLSGRRGNASRACWRESPRGLAPLKNDPPLLPRLLGLPRTVPLFLHPSFLITYTGNLNSKCFVHMI